MGIVSPCCAAPSKISNFSLMGFSVTGSGSSEHKVSSMVMKRLMLLIGSSAIRKATLPVMTSSRLNLKEKRKSQKQD